MPTHDDLQRLAAQLHNGNCMHAPTGQLLPLVLLAFILPAAAAPAAVIATSKGIGADAEVRDHQPTTNFGASTELATRIVDNFPLGHANDGTDRFSAMYLKFDITGQAVLPSQITSLRLTYRNNTFGANRVEDTTPPGDNTGYRTGLAFYGLDRDDPGNNWSESAITYLNAPGMAGGGDLNNGTKDFDFVDPDGAGPLRAPLTPLGVAIFPEVEPQNHLPVGGALLFSNTALNTFVTNSLNAGKTSVTIVAAVVHDGKVPVTDWKNFSYLFNPKEQTTLNADVNYDSNINDPDNPLGSPWSGASNVADASGFSPFSPQLIIATATGDFNHDGVVNAADYTIWRNTLGQTAASLPADGNGDLHVDRNDYLLWRRTFGQPAGSDAAAGENPSIPEPAPIVALLTGMLTVAARHRGRIGHRPTIHAMHDGHLGRVEQFSTGETSHGKTLTARSGTALRSRRNGSGTSRPAAAECTPVSYRVKRGRTKRITSWKNRGFHQSVAVPLAPWFAACHSRPKSIL